MIKLKKRYKFTGGENLQWFLKMEIIRDRRKEYVALTQKVHLKRLCKDYNINIRPITPITQDELIPYKGMVIKLKVKRY